MRLALRQASVPPPADTAQPPRMPTAPPASTKGLLTPEILEPGRRQFGVADGMLDVPVAEIGLQRPRVVALIGERIPAGVPQHMRMRLVGELGGPARTLDDAGLPHCTAHGLRKAAAARLAELGASEKEIMAVTGHRTSKEITRYTRGASQRILAANAIARHGPLNVTHSEAKIPRGAQDDSLSADFIDENIEMVPRGGIEPPTLRFSVACSTN
jgi:hypothetical protein